MSDLQKASESHFIKIEKYHRDALDYWITILFESMALYEMSLISALALAYFCPLLVYNLEIEQIKTSVSGLSEIRTIVTQVYNFILYKFHSIVGFQPRSLFIEATKWL